MADGAGVAEPLLFRHFGSKAGLFDVVVVRPVIATRDEVSHSVHRDADVGVFARALFDGLQGRCRECLALSSAVAQAPPDLVSAGAVERVAGAIDGLHAAAATAVGDIVTARVLVAAAWSLAIHGEWFRRPIGKSRVRDALVALAEHGALIR